MDQRFQKFTKTLKQKSNIFCIIFIAILFSFFVYSDKDFLFQKFDREVVGRYLKSQDIEDREGKIKDRIIISDNDVYIATGFLYATGTDPTEYNAPHTPLIKYLFGFSAKYLNLPLFSNLVLSFLFLVSVYLMGKIVFKSEIVGLLSSIMLLFDPVFKEVTIYALLDLGQMVFIMYFFILNFKKKENLLAKGIFLGLAAASKFYSPVVIFLLLLYLYKLINNKFNIKKEILVLFFAAATFFGVYIVTLIDKGVIYTFYNQAKIIKYMVTHNTATTWGKSLELFFEGPFFWQISLFSSVFMLLKNNYKSSKFFVMFVPIVILLMLSFQLSFTRYFIMVLPFLYLGFAYFLFYIIGKFSKNK